MNVLQSVGQLGNYLHNNVVSEGALFNHALQGTAFVVLGHETVAATECTRPSHAFCPERDVHFLHVGNLRSSAKTKGCLS